MCATLYHISAAKKKTLQTVCIASSLPPYGYALKIEERITWLNFEKKYHYTNTVIKGIE